MLAVKLDNTVNSHPHAGLLAADVVYLEEVEYGLTRFMAVFSSRYPKVVGPVRSARRERPGDPRAVRKGRLRLLRAPTRRSSTRSTAAPLYPLSNDAGAAGYSRSPDRTAPWDLFADPDELLEGAPKATEAQGRRIQLRRARPRPGGKKVKEFTAFWPSAQAQVRLVAEGGALAAAGWTVNPAMTTEGPQLGGTTVIVQRVDVYPSQSRRRATAGSTPTTETVGKGEAWMFRDGQVWPDHVVASDSRRRHDLEVQGSQSGLSTPVRSGSCCSTTTAGRRSAERSARADPFCCGAYPLRTANVRPVRWGSTAGPGPALGGVLLHRLSEVSVSANTPATCVT